jgi:hypothetical protein
MNPELDLMILSEIAPRLDVVRHEELARVLLGEVGHDRVGPATGGSAEIDQG